MAKGVEMFYFYLGCFFAGATLGLLTGLSETPVVATILSILLPFLAGILVFVSHNKADEEKTGLIPVKHLGIAGGKVIAITTGLIIGIFFGMYFRNMGLQNAESLAPSLRLSRALTYQDIVNMLEGQVSNEVILELVAHSQKGDAFKLTPEQVVTLNTLNSELVRELASLDYRYTYKNHNQFVMETLQELKDKGVLGGPIESTVLKSMKLSSPVRDRSAEKTMSLKRNNQQESKP